MFERDAANIDSTEFAQPAIFALEYALAEMWKARGVAPAYVLGHSVGEFAAAVVAGMMSVEDGMRLIAARGRLMQETCEPGAGSMAAVFAAEAEVEAALRAVADADPSARAAVSLAAVNGPTLCVVSGRKSAVDEVMKAAGVSSRALNVSHGFHSPLMAPMVDAFRAEAATCAFRRGTVRMVSTVTGAEVAAVDAAYWAAHLSGTVRFADGMRALAAAGVDAFVEIGADATLVKMGKRCVESDARWVASLERGEAAAVTTERAAAALSAAASALAYDRQLFLWRRVAHAMLGYEVARDAHGAEFERVVTPERLGFYADHVVNGEVWSPGASQLQLMAAAAMLLEQPRAESAGLAPGTSVELSDVVLPQPLR